MMDGDVGDVLSKGVVLLALAALVVACVRRAARLISEPTEEGEPWSNGSASGRDLWGVLAKLRDRAGHARESYQRDYKDAVATRKKAALPNLKLSLQKCANAAALYYCTVRDELVSAERAAAGYLPADAVARLRDQLQTAQAELAFVHGAADALEANSGPRVVNEAVETMQDADVDSILFSQEPKRLRQHSAVVHAIQRQQQDRSLKRATSASSRGQHTESSSEKCDAASPHAVLTSAEERMRIRQMKSSSLTRKPRRK